MAKHRTYTENDLRYLRMLARMFPTVRAAATEIINLNAILNLPKGCEHFVSDLHGEHEAFLHILNSCSGVIRERLDELFVNTVPRDELNQLATLIYYPKEKLEQLKPQIRDMEEWYRITIHRLIQVARATSERYTRSKVRKNLPPNYAYILEELLYTHGEDLDKRDYFENIISTIIAIGQAPDLIAAICAGCTATESVIREYDAEGNLLKKTYTSESLVKDITESTKNKTLVVWENGWAAYLSASTATNDDPTPTVKMWAGKASKGVISAIPDQQNWDGIAATITATREEQQIKLIPYYAWDNRAPGKMQVWIPFKQM